MDYRPAWLPRIEAMRDKEVCVILQTEAKTDTIGRWLRTLRRMYRMKEHKDFTYILAGKVWPKGKARGASYKPKEPEAPKDEFGDMKRAQWDQDVDQVTVRTNAPSRQRFTDYEPFEE